MSSFGILDKHRCKTNRPKKYLTIFCSNLFRGVFFSWVGTQRKNTRYSDD